MNDERDILKINSHIISFFQNEFSQLSTYKIRLSEIKKIIEDNDISDQNDLIIINFDLLRNKIENIENKIDYNFYISESAEIIENYKTILNTPIKISFIGKQVNNNKKKETLIIKYLSIAKKYLDREENDAILKEILHKSSNSITASQAEHAKNQKINCNNCQNKKNFEMLEDDIIVCAECYSQQVIVRYTSSYKDADRVNISSKYTYDRRIHFRDAINQFQGKQNSTIDKCVYDLLIKELSNHHLLVGNEQTPQKERFKNVTKEHIMMFLKELNFSKHYENANLLFCNITGKKPEDISHLEEKLMHDFDKLTELYDKTFKGIERKNFINTQYILFQLLTRHKYKCNKSDFSILKTMDRKTFHDDICRVLFSHLGWNYESYF